jgi:hypothetical protein
MLAENYPAITCKTTLSAPCARISPSAHGTLPYSLTSAYAEILRIRAAISIAKA